MIDTIAAVSTALAPSGIGIIRLSGPDCWRITETVFVPDSGKPFSLLPERKLVLGTLYDGQGAAIDRPLAVRWAEGHSYTGEAAAELHCHGSPVVLTAALEALIRAGARQARPGEFTQRAFLNGRMDLTAAEAVIDLIEAETPEMARNAVAQLSGAVFLRIDAIYQTLVEMIAHFQAIIDYPDEDIEPQDAGRQADILDGAAEQLQRLADSFRRGWILKNGLPAVLLGSPNSGKSTLLNSLLGYERAIVTPVAGTTRDTLEEKVRLGGLLLRLTDTAGIRRGGDEIENMGIDRALAAADSAALCLLVLDGSRPLEPSDGEAIRVALMADRRIALINKSDLPQQLDESALPGGFDAVLSISAKTGAGLEELENQIARLYPADRDKAPAGEMLTNLRQQQAVQRALEYVRGARQALSAGLTPDAALSDVELALEELGQLTGRQVSQDVVDGIFSRFCVGK